MKDSLTNKLDLMQGTVELIEGQAESIHNAYHVLNSRVDHLIKHMDYGMIGPRDGEEMILNVCPKSEQEALLSLQ